MYVNEPMVYARVSNSQDNQNLSPAFFADLALTPHWGKKMVFNIHYLKKSFPHH